MKWDDFPRNFVFAWQCAATQVKSDNYEEKYVSNVVFIHSNNVFLYVPDYFNFKPDVAKNIPNNSLL